MKTQAIVFLMSAAICATAQWNVIQPNRNPARPLNSTRPTTTQPPQVMQQVPQRPQPPAQVQPQQRPQQPPRPVQPPAQVQPPQRPQPPPQVQPPQRPQPPPQVQPTRPVQSPAVSAKPPHLTPPPQVQPTRPMPPPAVSAKPPHPAPPPQPIFTQPKPAPKPAPQPGPRVAQPVPQPVFNPPYKIPNYTLQSHNAPVFVPHSSLFTTHAAFITPRAPYLSYYSGGGYYFIPYDNIYAITPSSSYAGNYAMPADTLPQNSVWIGQFLTTDEAKEIAVPEYVYNKICIELVSGTVSLNTVWLRPEKTEVRVASRLQPGEILTIDLGNAPRAINGLRISDNGRGVYRIYGL